MKPENDSPARLIVDVDERVPDSPAKLLPEQHENPDGLHRRYKVEKVHGEDDPRAFYFVLRLDQYGDDPWWIDCCREAANHLCNAMRARDGRFDGIAEDLERYLVSTQLDDSPKLLFSKAADSPAKLDAPGEGRELPWTEAMERLLVEIAKDVGFDHVAGPTKPAWYRQLIFDAVRSVSSETEELRREIERLKGELAPWQPERAKALKMIVELEQANAALTATNKALGESHAKYASEAHRLQMLAASQIDRINALVKERDELEAWIARFGPNRSQKELIEKLTTATARIAELEAEVMRRRSTS